MIILHDTAGSCGGMNALILPGVRGPASTKPAPAHPTYASSGHNGGSPMAWHQGGGIDSGLTILRFAAPITGQGTASSVGRAADS